MKALNNFLISWLLMFFIAVAATVRLFISPFLFVFSLEKYNQSTAFKAADVVVNMTELGYLCSDYFKRYWRE